MVRRAMVSMSVVVLLLALGATLVAAQPVTINLWVSFGDERFDYYEPLIAEFEAQNPGITVNLERHGQWPDEVIPKVAAGITPDVFRLSHAVVNTYAHQDFLVDLLPFMERDGVADELFADYLPGTWPALMWEGKVYGLPSDLFTYITMYDRNILSESGVPEPQRGWTWDDFVSDAQRLHRVGADGNVDRYGIIQRAALGTHAPFLLQLGGSFWSEDYRSATVNTPQMRQSLEFMSDLMGRGLMWWRQGSAITNAFIAGQGGYYFDSDGRIFVLDQVDGLAVAPAMRYQDRDPVAALTISGHSVWNSGDPVRHDAAWKLTYFLSSTEAQARYISQIQRVPSRISAIQSETYQRFLDDNNLDSLRTVAMEVGPYATGLGFTGFPNWDPWYRQVYVPITNQFLSENPMPVVELMERLQHETQLMIDEFFAGR